MLRGGNPGLVPVYAGGPDASILGTRRRLSGFPASLGDGDQPRALPLSRHIGGLGSARVARAGLSQ